MDRQRLARLGLIGLILVALLGLFYFWSKQQQAKRARQVPEDDRGIR